MITDILEIYTGAQTTKGLGFPSHRKRMAEEKRSKSKQTQGSPAHVYSPPSRKMKKKKKTDFVIYIVLYCLKIQVSKKRSNRTKSINYIRSD